MLNRYWNVLKNAVSGFSGDNCLSRGAAIAYYTVFSLAPVLVIVIAIAGLVFGADAARGAIVDQIGGMMGRQGADAIQSMIQSASGKKTGVVATVIGVVTLLVTASGVFGEMQAALNAIWRAEPKSGTISRLVRARIASLGLVMTLGFLLMVSLVISAGLTALGGFVNDLLPGGAILMRVANLLISFALIAVLFATIYKVLPDKRIEWRDVLVGAAATSALFTVGKFLISLYIGSSAVGSTFGAAGALAIVLVWIYYSSQIFLFGAEFTRAYAEMHGSHAGVLGSEGTPGGAGVSTTAPVPGAGAAAPGTAPTGSHSAQIENLKAKLEQVARPR